MATTSAERIIVLDIIRGLAVMGIFSVNVVGMAMIENAYFFPPDYGFDSLGDRIMWAANFILVDGKFRSLFSILFGASTILVIERGMAAGKKDWQVHYPRMFALLLFGLLHFYLLWWGDILANYALVGMIAFVFWRLPVKWLMTAAIVALIANAAPAMILGTQQVAEYEAKRAPDATPEQRKSLAELLDSLNSSNEDIAEDKAAHVSLPAHIEQTIDEAPWRPFSSVAGYGLETLGLMLLGMAGYKSGFLIGAWSRRRYATVGAICAGVSIAYFATGAGIILSADFDPFPYYRWDQLWSAPLHPVGAVGYAALIILLFPTRGALADRVAAVGRAAFTNYLGSTIFGTLLFYEFGFGLYGDVSRGHAWLFAPLLWAIMLLWSKPWLDRYRYGPFEWAWRSLSRWRLEPMRRGAA